MNGFFGKSSFAGSSFFVMVDLSKQREAVKLCFLFGKNAAETVVRVNTGYKASTMGKTQVYECSSRFKTSEMSKCDKPRSGRPLT